MRTMGSRRETKTVQLPLRVEPAVGEVKVVLRKQDIASVFIQQRPAGPQADDIGNDRANRVADSPESAGDKNPV